MIEVAYGMLGLAVLAFGYRAAAGPSLSDRVIAVNGLLTAGMAAIVVHAVQTDTGSFLPVLLVVGLVAFVGTGMLARYIEGHGR